MLHEAGPQVLRGVGARGPPPFCQGDDAPRTARGAEPFDGLSDPEIRGEERVGVAESPHRNVRSGPGSYPPQPLQPPPPPPHDPNRGRARSTRRPGHAPDHGGFRNGPRLRPSFPQDLPRPRLQAAKKMREPKVFCDQRFWKRFPAGVTTSRPARVLAPATLTCWPSTARNTSSAPSTLAGTRRPGERRTRSPATGRSRARRRWQRDRRRDRGDGGNAVPLYRDPSGLSSLRIAAYVVAAV